METYDREAHQNAARRGEQYTYIEWGVRLPDGTEHWSGDPAIGFANFQTEEGRAEWRASRELMMGSLGLNLTDTAEFIARDVHISYSAPRSAVRQDHAERLARRLEQAQ